MAGPTQGAGCLALSRLSLAMRPFKSARQLPQVAVGDAEAGNALTWRGRVPLVFASRALVVGAWRPPQKSTSCLRQSARRSRRASLSDSRVGTRLQFEPRRSFIRCAERRFSSGQQRRHCRGLWGHIAGHRRAEVPCQPGRARCSRPSEVWRRRSSTTGDVVGLRPAARRHSRGRGQGCCRGRRRRISLLCQAGGNQGDSATCPASANNRAATGPAGGLARRHEAERPGR